MKTLNNILKVLTALAAIAGAIYIVATYGEQIVAWAKRMLSLMSECPRSVEIEVKADVVGEDAAASEEEAEEPAAPAEEPAAVAEHEPVAEETDFAE